MNYGGPFPKLKTKAAESRHLGRPLLEIWRDNAEEDEAHQNITRALELSVLLEDIQAASHLFLLLTPASAVQEKKLVLCSLASLMKTSTC